MKKVFEASYKSFYYPFIAFLWGLAIILAVIQSNIVTEITIKSILPKYGLHIGSAKGGLLSGMELKDIKYKELLVASEIRFDVNYIALLSKELELEYLDIKNLKIDEKELKKTLQKEGSSQKPEWLDVVKLEKISITLLDFAYDELKINRLSLHSDYTYYNFDKFYMELKSDIDSNLFNTKFHGDILDKNYAFRGSLQTNGSTYINTLVGDDDFEFNNLKYADYVLKGDDTNLYLKAHFKNSGPIYKYNVDAKLNDVISELHLNLKNWSLRIDSKGEIGSRYGVIDSLFSVVYDGNRTVYYGDAKAKKFTYIPLGVFEKSLKIKEAKNHKISFFGDVHKVEINTSNTIRATLLDKRFDVDGADTTVFYDIDKERLKVSTAAKLQTDYFKADIENTVEDADKLTFGGIVHNFKNLDTPVNPIAFDAMSIEYHGDEDTLSVGAKSKSIELNIDSKGYDKYRFDAKLDGVKAADESLKAIVSSKISGRYKYSEDEISALVELHNSKLFSKSVEAKKIGFYKKGGAITLPKTSVKIANVDLQMEAKTDRNILEAYVSSAGLNIKAKGEIGKKTDISIVGNLEKIAADIAKITGKKKQALSGDFEIKGQITGEPKDKNFTLEASSKKLSIADEELEDIHIVSQMTGEELLLKELEAKFQAKRYALSKPSLIKVTDTLVEAKEFVLNDTLRASFVYADKKLAADAKIKNFKYNDKDKLSFVLDADLFANYQNGKLTLRGDAFLKDLRAAYELKSSNITKDKDIIILRDKRVDFGDTKFEENIALQLNITNTNAAYYKSKEAYAPLDLNLLYYKDFNKKPVLLGLIKTGRGYYDLEGKRFALLPGDIALTQVEPNNPYLDLTLKHADKDVEISIYVREFASAPKISFSSNPAMSEKEIISYLLFGVDPGSGFTKMSNDARYSSKAIGALSNALSRDLTKELGIKLDKVEISPTEVVDKSGRTTQTTKVEIGKRVTKDLTVTYKNDIESSVVFEYQINKNVAVESQAGSKSSIDIFYKQDY